MLSAMAFAILRRVFLSRSTAKSLLSSQRSRFSTSRASSAVVDDDRRRSVNDRIQLSPLFQETGDDGIKDCRIELIDDSTWNVSSGLAEAWRGSNEAAASRMRSCFSDDECDFAADDDDENCVANDGYDFDDIEDMHIRGNLFYKLDKGSKEYEECTFDFHGSKTARNEREQRRNKERKNENPNLAMASKFETTWRKERMREMKKIEAEFLASEARQKPNSRLHEVGDARSHVKIEGRKKETPNLALASILVMNSKKNRTREIRKSEEHNYEKATFLASERNEKPNPRLQEEGDARYVKNKRTPTFNQLTAAYHEPFCLDVYISKGSIRASIIHRATSNVVIVAHSISKDMKFDLGSTKNKNTCAAVGKVLAQRALDDDIHNVIYTPRKGERIEGKLRIVVDSIIHGGVDVKVKLKQRSFKQAKNFLP